MINFRSSPRARRLLRVSGHTSSVRSAALLRRARRWAFPSTLANLAVRIEHANSENWWDGRSHTAYEADRLTPRFLLDAVQIGGRNMVKCTRLGLPIAVILSSLSKPQLVRTKIYISRIPHRKPLLLAKFPTALTASRSSC